jgi:hypothetical protein
MYRSELKNATRCSSLELEQLEEVVLVAGQAILVLVRKVAVQGQVLRTHLEI